MLCFQQTPFFLCVNKCNKQLLASIPICNHLYIMIGVCVFLLNCIYVYMHCVLTAKTPVGYEMFCLKKRLYSVISFKHSEVCYG